MNLTAYQKFRIQQMAQRVVAVIVLIAILFFLKLKGCQPKSENRLLTDDRIQHGSGQEFRDAELRAYSDTVKTWYLRSRHVRQDPDSNCIHVAPVYLEMYGKSGAIAATIIADSGRTSSDLTAYRVWGHVIITDSSGTRVRSKSMNWNKNDKLIFSEDYVEITTAKGEILRGKGFTADDTFDWWEFQKDVSGEFGNFDQEIGF